MELNQQEIDTQNYVAQHYENTRYKVDYALKYHDWWSKKMLRLVKPQGRILDNGCGTGHFVEKYLPDYDVYGIDIAEEMVKYAKNRMKNVQVADAQDLPFEDNYFDTIFARGLIHHLPNPGLGVKEMSRTLKPGGRVLFVDPLKSFLSDLPRKIANKKSKHFSEEHKNFYKQEVIDIIREHLSIEKVYPFGYIAYPFLGFPDVLPVYKYVPLKFVFTPLLIKFDELVSYLPFIKNQGWGIMIVASKK